MSRKLRPPVACIGAGRLARVVLPGLAAAGWPVVAVAASRRSTAQRLCRVLPGARAVARPGKAASDAELLLLAVPDREIAPLGARLAEEEEIDWSGRVVLHHAGSLGLLPLAPLSRAGAAVGVWRIDVIDDLRVVKIGPHVDHIESRPAVEKPVIRAAVDEVVSRVALDPNV